MANTTTAIFPKLHETWDIFEDFTSSENKEEKNYPINIVESLATTLAFCSQGEDSGVVIIDTITSSESWKVFKQKNIQQWPEFISQAHHMLDYWGKIFMVSRLSGKDAYNATRWKTKLLECINDREQLVTLSHLKVICTLPRYTATEMDFDFLRENYRPWDSTHSTDARELTFIKKIFRQNSRKSPQNWYCFCDSQKQLFIIPVSLVGRESNVWADAMMQAVLAANNNRLKIKFSPSVRFLSGKFQFGNIETIEEFC